MVQPYVPSRKCPKCGKSDYKFRGCKKIPPNPETGDGEQWDTKFRCRACEHEWREKELVRGG
jgi:hypothetical protein